MKESIHGKRITRDEALRGLGYPGESDIDYTKPNPNWVTPPPDGYFVLHKGAPVRRGDFWLRPYDGCWVETGKAHWGCLVTRENEFARRNNPEPPEVEYRYEAVHHHHSERFDE